MTYYIRQGSTYTIADEADIEVTTHLPPSIYVLKDMMGRFFLEKIDPFKDPRKFYGTALKDAHRIIETYKRRQNSTGVHMDGVKGSGKTLLGRTICNIAMREFDMPVILVNTPYRGENFNKFIQDIEGDAVVFFDEFEKVYGPEEQEQLLSLFDGVYLQRKLFIITTNDAYRVCGFLKNRPGRMFYSLKFGCLDKDFVREYCVDTLNDQSYTDKVVDFATLYDNITFDMLQALVDEMNRYGEGVKESLKWLNIQPENTSYNSFTYSVVIKTQDRSYLYHQATQFDVNELQPDNDNWAYYLSNLLRLGIPSDLVVAAVTSADGLPPETENAMIGFNPGSRAAVAAKRAPKSRGKTTRAVPKLGSNWGDDPEVKQDIDDTLVLKYEHLVDINIREMEYTFKVGPLQVVFRRNSRAPTYDVMDAF